MSITKKGKKCPNCGRGVNAKWNYCPMCGHELKEVKKP